MIAGFRHHQSPTDIAGYDPTRVGGDFFYDGEAAEKAVEFFADTLVHLDGDEAGEPFQLQAWQADVIRVAFGWKRLDGKRRYRTIFWFVPRKNGKTTIASGMALKCFYADGERRAQCYCAACDLDQATLLFDMSRDQVLASETLSGVSKVRDSRKRIIYKDRFFRALAASDSGGHGMNLHFGAYDEFHLWRTAKHIEMFESLHTSTGNRSQPLELIITTAGWDRQSLCYKEYRRACQVRDGKIDDDSYLPVIYEAGEHDDWTDPKVWAKANPNLGVTISEDYIRRECENAKRDPGYENTFRRLHLNMWTSQESRWLKMDDWRNCPATEGEISDEVTQVGGLDLSAVEDFTAWMRAQRDGDVIRCRGHYFLPERKVHEYERTGIIPVQKWIREGWITVIPGAEIEHSYIYNKITQDRHAFGIVDLGFDSWNASWLRQTLEADGMQPIKVPQTYQGMSDAAKDLQRHVIGGRLDHGNDPVLEWMAENVYVIPDANDNIRPTKKNVTGKVDGIVALINAIHVLNAVQPPAESGLCVL